MIMKMCASRFYFAFNISRYWKPYPTKPIITKDSLTFSIFVQNFDLCVTECSVLYHISLVSDRVNGVCLLFFESSNEKEKNMEKR